MTADAIPTTVGSFSFDGENRSESMVIIDYLEAGTNRTMAGTLFIYGGFFNRSVERLEDAAYYGRAVCGFSRATSDGFPTCVMAGRAEVLNVSSANEDVTIDDVAACTEALYDSL